MVVEWHFSEKSYLEIFTYSSSFITNNIHILVEMGLYLMLKWMSFDLVICVQKSKYQLQGQIITPTATMGHNYLSLPLITVPVREQLNE